MLAVTICASKSYCYASFAQSRRLQGMIKDEPEGVIILVGDTSAEFRAACARFEEILPSGWEVERHELPEIEESANYKPPVQRVIAQMRTMGFTRARRRRVDFCLSLDSDVLPQANALRVMRQMLEFDDGYYSISTCPYPSQGGTLFLGGRGTPRDPILPDVYDDERVIPKALQAKLDARKKLAKAKGFKPTPKWWEEERRLREQIKRLPAKGNVWALNAAGYRRRGWLDMAYPGIGRGAVVPIEWCGFGCTLMNSRALDLAQFDGYGGGGTEDLYIVYKRWHRAGLRINAIAHCPADHVSRVRSKGKVVPGRYVLQQTYHEAEGECEGHLRVELRRFFDSSVGEGAVRVEDAESAPPARTEARNSRSRRKGVADGDGGDGAARGDCVVGGGGEMGAPILEPVQRGVHSPAAAGGIRAGEAPSGGGDA